MRWIAALLLALSAATAVLAQLPPPARRAAPGLVEVATSRELAPLLVQLAAAYRQQHPGITISIAARGSNVAMALLITAQADLAVIGRGASEQEAKGFEWIYHSPPAAQPLFAGSESRPGHSPRVAVLVSTNSPLRSITLAQLAAHFLPGGSGRIFMPDAESGTGRFFRHSVLADANQLDWDRITEFAETDHSRPGDVARKIAAEVARDPATIGIADATPRRGVRAIPVTDAGDTLQRNVLAYFGHPARAEAAGFIRFIRSSQAALIIAASPYTAIKSPPATAP